MQGAILLGYETFLEVTAHRLRATQQGLTLRVCFLTLREPAYSAPFILTVPETWTPREF